MVLGLVLNQDGRPVCSEMRPGNIADVTALEAVAARLRHRFGIRSVCLVADRGMISKRTMAAIEARGWWYILGARPRATREVREEVLTDTGAMTTFTVARAHDPEPLTLEIKEVVLQRPGEDGERAGGAALLCCLPQPGRGTTRRSEPGGGAISRPRARASGSMPTRCARRRNTTRLGSAHQHDPSNAGGGVECG